MLRSLPTRCVGEFGVEPGELLAAAFKVAEASGGLFAEREDVRHRAAVLVAEGFDERDAGFELGELDHEGVELAVGDGGGVEDVVGMIVCVQLLPQH